MLSSGVRSCVGGDVGPVFWRGRVAQLNVGMRPAFRISRRPVYIATATAETSSSRDRGERRGATGCLLVEGGRVEELFLRKTLVRPFQAREFVGFLLLSSSPERETVTKQLILCSLLATSSLAGIECVVRKNRTEGRVRSYDIDSLFVCVVCCYCLLLCVWRINIVSCYIDWRAR